MKLINNCFNASWGILVLALVGMCGSLQAQVIFTDDFNRSDTSSTEPYGGLGTDYTLSSGARLYISNGAAVGALATGSTQQDNIALYNGASLSESFSMSAVFSANTYAGWAGLVFNYVDSLNYYQVRFKILNGSNFNYQVLKVEGGATTAITNAYGSVALTTNTQYVLSVSSTATAGTYAYSLTDVTGATTYLSKTFSNSVFPIGGYAGFDLNPANPPSTISLDSFSLTTVPEPGTMAMLGLGLIGVVAMRKRR